jgi:hypothetical protein
MNRTPVHTHTYVSSGAQIAVGSLRIIMKQGAGRSLQRVTSLQKANVNSLLLERLIP